MKKYKLPQNVSAQDGRLYFRKLYKGHWYRAAFGLVDSNVNRRTVQHIVSEIELLPENRTVT